MTQNGNLRFQVSDKVVHPRMGAGQIVDVEHRELMAGFKRYYVIDMFDKSLTLRVPVRMADEVGMRPVMSEAKIAEVLAILSETPRQLPSDYKERQSLIYGELGSDDPLRTAQAVRDLFCHGQMAHLTKGDSMLLGQGRDSLAIEMALACDMTLNEVNQQIDTALNESVPQTG